MFNPLKLTRSVINSPNKRLPNLKTKQGRIYAILKEAKSITPAFSALNQTKEICKNILNSNPFSPYERKILSRQLASFKKREITLSSLKSEREICRYILLGGSLESLIKSYQANNTPNNLKKLVVAYHAALIYEKKGWIINKDNIHNKLLFDFLQIKDQAGNTPLLIACLEKNKEALKLFLNTLIENVADNGVFGWVTYGVQSIREIVDKSYKKLTKKDIKKLFIQGFSPFIYEAFRLGNAETTHVLLQFLKTHHMLNLIEISPSFYGSSGIPAIHYAFGVGSTETVKTILQFLKTHHMLNLIETKNNEGYTLMHYALQFENIETINLTLQFLKAHHMLNLIETKNNAGHTPIYYAFRLGGDAKKIDTILNFLKENEKLYLLETKSLKGHTPIHGIFKYGNVKTLQTTLQFLKTHHMLNLIETKNEEGYTPIHYAFLLGNTNTIKAFLIFLKKKNKLHLLKTKDHYGYTPIYYACFNDNSKVFHTILQFLEKSAKFNLLNMLKEKKCNNTPLIHIALQNQKTEIINTIFKGLSPDFSIQLALIEDNQGKTVYQLTLEENSKTTALWNEQYKKSTLASLMNKFPAFQNKSFEDILSLFKQTPSSFAEQLLSSSNDPDANPLELVLYLDNEKLGEAIYKKIGAKKWDQYVDAIKKQNPNQSLDLLFNCRYDILCDFLKEKVDTNIEEPQIPVLKEGDQEFKGLDILQKFFSDITFYDSNKEKQPQDDKTKIYKDLKTITDDKKPVTKEFLQENLNDFIFIINKEANSYDNGKDTTDFKRLYSISRKKLYHVINQMLKETDLHDRASVAIDCAIAGNHCFARKKGISDQLYREKIQKQPSDLKSQIEKALINLAINTCELIASLNKGDVHVRNSLLYHIGLSPIKDELLNKNTAEKLFFKKYYPKKLIDYIFDMTKDESFYSLLKQKLKEKMPKDWKPSLKTYCKYIFFDQEAIENLSDEEKKSINELSLNARQELYLLYKGYIVEENITKYAIAKILEEMKVLKDKSFFK